MKILKQNSEKTPKELWEILYEEAHEKWKMNEKIIDDITIVICVF